MAMHQAAPAAENDEND